MIAKDVMTHKIISIGPDSSIAEAIRLMLQNRISGLPVVERDGKLVGIVTEGDFLRRTETGTERKRPRWVEFLVGPGRLADEYTHTHGRRVDEVMTASPATITESTPLDEAVLLMEKRHIKRLPVLRDGKVVGIIARADVLRAMVRSLGAATPSDHDDARIRARVIAELEAQPWTPRAMIDIGVQDGVVELCGTILDERCRQALRVAAENVPGVKAVIDHLVWVEPVSGFVVEPSDKGATTQTNSSGSAEPAQHR